MAAGGLDLHARVFGPGTTAPGMTAAEAPLNDSPEKEDLAQQVMKDIAGSEGAFQAWEGPAKEEVNFYNGHAWDDVDRMRMESLKRPALSFNEILPVIDAVSGLERLNRTDARFVSRALDADPIHDAAGDLASEAVSAADELCNSPEEESEVAKTMAISGMAWGEICMDYNHDLNGRVVFKQIPNKEMRWDPNSHMPNKEDRKWCARKRPVSRQAFAKLWPGMLEKIDAAVPEMPYGQTQKYELVTPYYSYANQQANPQVGQATTLKKDIEVIQYQWRDMQPVYRFQDEDSGEIAVLDEDKWDRLGDRVKMLGGAPPPAVKQFKPVYRQVEISRGVCLDDPVDLPGGFSLLCCTGKWDDDKKRHYGLVRPMIDPQKTKNKAISSALGFHILNAKGGVIFKTSYFADPTDAQNQWAQPDAWIEANDDADLAGGLRQREPQQMPQELGMFYCYSDDTEVLTKRGWLRFADTVESDVFATRHPTIHEFEWQAATSRFRQQYQGEMIRLWSCSLNLLVTPNHRVLVRQVSSGRESIREANTLLEHSDDVAIPVTSSWTGTELREMRFECARKGETGRHCQTVVMTGDQFCAFMGMWLAEGSVGRAGHTKASRLGRIQIHQPDGDMRGARQCYRALLREIFGSVCESTHTLYWGRKGLAEYLRQFGHAAEKFIPDEIKNATPRQIAIFWRYYHLGDGTDRRQGRKESGAGCDCAFTVSKRLADDLSEVTQKIGLSITVSKRPPSQSNIKGRAIQSKGGYFISVRRTQAMRFHAERTTYEGSVACVSVPNTVLYVRRNGKACWSGNSEASKAITQVSGVNAELVGMATGQTPSQTAGRRVQAGLVVLGWYWDNWNRFKRARARMMLEFIREYWTQGQYIQVGGDFNSQAIPLVKESLPLDYSLVLDDSVRHNPNLKAQVWADLMDSGILQALMKFGLGQMILKLLKYSPFPTQIVQDIQREAAENPPQPPQKGRGKQDAPELIDAKVKQMNAQAMKAIAQAKMIDQQSGLKLAEIVTEGTLGAHRIRAEREKALTKGFGHGLGSQSHQSRRPALNISRTYPV